MLRDRAAVVCRRGHVLANDRDGSVPSDWPEAWEGLKCPRCGGKVYVVCPACSESIFIETDADYSRVPFPFCICGRALPWADRQAKIHELENLLDDEGLDPGDEAMVRQQLETLRRADLSGAEEVRLWSRVRDLAPKVWEIANGRGILTAVITSEAKSKLGLPV